MYVIKMFRISDIIANNKCPKLMVKKIIYKLIVDILYRQEERPWKKARLI